MPFGLEILLAQGAYALVKSLSADSTDKSADRPDGVLSEDTAGQYPFASKPQDSVQVSASNPLSILLSPRFGPLTLWTQQCNEAEDPGCSKKGLEQELAAIEGLLKEHNYFFAESMSKEVLERNPENDQALKLYLWSSYRQYEETQLGDKLFSKLLGLGQKREEEIKDPLKERALKGLKLLDRLDKIDYVDPGNGKLGYPPVQAKATRDKIIGFLKTEGADYGVLPGLEKDVRVLERYSKYLKQIAAARQTFASHLPVYVQKHIEETQSYKTLRLFYLSGNPDVPKDWPCDSTKDDDGNILSEGINDSALPRVYQQLKDEDPEWGANLDSAFKILQEDVLPALPDITTMRLSSSGKQGSDLLSALKRGSGKRPGDIIKMRSSSDLQRSVSYETQEPQATSIEELEAQLDKLEPKLVAAKLDEFEARIEEHELDKEKGNPGYHARQGVREAQQNLDQTARVLKFIDDGIAGKKPIDKESLDTMVSLLREQAESAKTRLKELSSNLPYKRDGSLQAALRQAETILTTIDGLSADNANAAQVLQTAYRGLASVQAAELKAHMVVNAINVGLVGKDPIEGALRSVSQVSVQFGGPSIDREDYNAFIRERGLNGNDINKQDAIQQVLLWKIVKQQEVKQQGSLGKIEPKQFNNQSVSDTVGSATGLDTVFTIWGVKDFQSVNEIARLLASSQEVIQGQDRLALRDTIEAARSEMIDLKMEVGQDRLLRERLSTGVYDYVIEEYNHALAALDKGDVRTAQAIFLKVRNREHPGAGWAFGQYKTDRLLEKVAFGVPIIMAAAFTGGAAAGALVGTDAAVGSGLWFAHTAISTAVFWGTSTTLNALVLGEVPEYFEATGADFAKGLALDVGLTYGMFLVLGGVMESYRGLVAEKVFGPKAMAELAKLGIRDVSSAEGQAMLRQLVLAQEKNLPLIAKGLYHGGMFATEYGAFTVWERIALSVNTIAKYGRDPNQAELEGFFSTASFADRLAFLLCLKVGNTMAHQAFVKVPKAGASPEVRGFMEARARFVTDLKSYLDSKPNAEEMPAKIKEFNARGAELARLGVALKGKLPAELYDQLTTELDEYARFSQGVEAGNSMPGEYASAHAEAKAPAAGTPIVGLTKPRKPAAASTKPKAPAKSSQEGNTHQNPIKLLLASLNILMAGFAGFDVGLPSKSSERGKKSGSQEPADKVSEPSKRTTPDEAAVNARSRRFWGDRARDERPVSPRDRLSADRAIDVPPVDVTPVDTRTTVTQTLKGEPTGRAETFTLAELQAMLLDSTLPLETRQELAKSTIVLDTQPMKAEGYDGDLRVADHHGPMADRTENTVAQLAGKFREARAKAGIGENERVNEDDPRLKKAIKELNLRFCTTDNLGDGVDAVFMVRNQKLFLADPAKLDLYDKGMRFLDFEAFGASYANTPYEQLPDHVKLALAHYYVHDSALKNPDLKFVPGGDRFTPENAPAIIDWELPQLEQIARNPAKLDEFARAEWDAVQESVSHARDHAVIDSITVDGKVVGYVYDNAAMAGRGNFSSSMGISRAHPETSFGFKVIEPPNAPRVIDADGKEIGRRRTYIIFLKHGNSFPNGEYLNGRLKAALEAADRKKAAEIEGSADDATKSNAGAVKVWIVRPDVIIPLGGTLLTPAEIEGVIARQQELFREPIQSHTVQGKSVASGTGVLDNMPAGQKVLLIDFAPENIPPDRAADAVIADHHSEGGAGKTATSEVLQLRREGKLADVVKIVSNHNDTDSVLAEAIGNGIITDPTMAERAVRAAQAGDYLIGDKEDMIINWIIMSMIHGDRGGKFPALPREEIVAKAADIINHPEKYEQYYQGMKGFIDASEAAVQSGSVQVNGRIGMIETRTYAHPLAGYWALDPTTAEVMIKYTPHEKGGYQYDIGFLPSKSNSKLSLAKAFEELKIMEAEAQKDNPNFNPSANWGCDPTRAGGSPRGYGSRLTPEQVRAVIAKYVTGEDAKQTETQAQPEVAASPESDDVTGVQVPVDWDPASSVPPASRPIPLRKPAAPATTDAAPDTVTDPKQAPAAVPKDTGDDVDPDAVTTVKPPPKRYRRIVDPDQRDQPKDLRESAGDVQPDGTGLTRKAPLQARDVKPQKDAAERARQARLQQELQPLRSALLTFDVRRARNAHRTSFVPVHEMKRSVGADGREVVTIEDVEVVDKMQIPSLIREIETQDVTVERITEVTASEKQLTVTLPSGRELTFTVRIVSPEMRRYPTPKLIRAEGLEPTRDARTRQIQPQEPEGTSETPPTGNVPVEANKDQPVDSIAMPPDVARNRSREKLFFGNYWVNDFLDGCKLMEPTLDHFADNPQSGVSAREFRAGLYALKARAKAYEKMRQEYYADIPPRRKAELFDQMVAYITDSVRLMKELKESPYYKMEIAYGTRAKRFTRELAPLRLAFFKFGMMQRQPLAQLKRGESSEVSDHVEFTPVEQLVPYAGDNFENLPDNEFFKIDDIQVRSPGQIAELVKVMKEFGVNVIDYGPVIDDATGKKRALTVEIPASKDAPGREVTFNVHIAP